MGKISQIEINNENYDIYDASATNKILELEESIPTKTSELENDSGFITGIDEDDVIDALGYLPPETDTQYQMQVQDNLLKLVETNGVSTFATDTETEALITIDHYSSILAVDSDGQLKGFRPIVYNDDINPNFRLPISQGGTNATTAAAALQNLGLTATATELNYCDGVTSNIQTQINDINTTIDSLNDFFGVGTSIPSGADLNTYTTVGKYYVGSTSLAATMVNAPVTNTNYTMFVIKRTTGSSITQIIVTLANTIYVRSATANGSLNKWEKCATSSDLTSHNSDTSAHSDIRTAITTAKSEANDYTDEKISALLDGASDTTLDSIKELSDAIKENDTAIEALNSIAATKAPASDLDALEETVGEVQTDVTDLQTQINTLLERIAGLETALANKQDKINTWEDLAEGAGTEVVNVAEEGA